ncbi:type VI secretion system contractile sheath large subunit [bacterium]|nr:type VI secretion system contractile sheath large subunit [bacterium]
MALKDDKVTAIAKKIARDPTDPMQVEFGEDLVRHFDQMQEGLKEFRAVKLLFSLNDSDSFNVREVTSGLQDAVANKTSVPKALELGFVLAGFPLPKSQTVADSGAQGWTVGVTQPEARSYTLTQVDSRIDVYGDSDDPSFFIEYRIAQIDQMISAQLSEIMHSKEFQRLEASWRGLHALVFNSETGTRLKLRLLDAQQKEVQDDLDNAVEFDQSGLFKKVYEDEYGLFGGSPYSALLADFEFGREPKDVSLLQKASNVAAAAHAPLITAAAPSLFDLDSFVDLDKPRDLAKIFESAELIKWRAFRDSEDSRYVTLTLPHTLMRLPYGPETNPVEEFNFLESADNPTDFLWGNAAWALGQRITEAFARYGWTAAIRGYEGGGLVTGLPIYTFKSEDGLITVRVPTEVAITDRREKELSDLGFISLIYRKGTDQAAFFGGQTANKPKVYIQDDATANARLSASLPYMLAASRFAHYIKVIMRDRVGSFMSQADVSTLLNRWISQYVLLNDSAGQETKAQYPLREARIDVTSDPRKPGRYMAVVFLRPHFQLEELTVSIRLVAELPPPAAA